MKWTPARTITSASVSTAIWARARESPGDVRRQVIDVRRHVVVGGDDGVALHFEPFDLVDDRPERGHFLFRQDIDERVIWRVVMGSR